MQEVLLRAVSTTPIGFQTHRQRDESVGPFRAWDWFSAHHLWDCNVSFGLGLIRYPLP